MQQNQQTYYLEIVLPGQQQGNIILRDAAALRFFLESVYRGNSYFNDGIVFNIAAFRSGEMEAIGQGKYKIVRNVLTFNLVTIDESGIFEKYSIIEKAWSQMRAEMSLDYRLMAHNVTPMSGPVTGQITRQF